MRQKTSMLVAFGAMLSLALVTACSDDAAGKPDAAPKVDAAPMVDALSDAAAAACAKNATAEVVTMTADDGQKLEGDLYRSGSAGGPAAVLLHMVPPSNTRTNYPAAFIEALVAKGLTVLNLDRRGAGGSTPGTPVDAYVGPKGKLDAKAAHDFLAAQACPIDTSRIVYVGASNGTTTALDFAVYAAGEATVASPRALVFLTGGGYTETNNQIAAQRTILDALPILFVYSKAERAWSVQYEAGKAASWLFKEYDPGDHGTLMFGAAPASIGDVADFVAAAVAP